MGFASLGFFRLDVVVQLIVAIALLVPALTLSTAVSLTPMPSTIFKWRCGSLAMFGIALYCLRFQLWVSIVVACLALFIAFMVEYLHWIVNHKILRGKEQCEEPTCMCHWSE